MLSQVCSETYLKPLCRTRTYSKCYPAGGQTKRRALLKELRRHLLASFQSLSLANMPVFPCSNKTCPRKEIQHPPTQSSMLMLVRRLCLDVPCCNILPCCPRNLCHCCVWLWPRSSEGKSPAQAGQEDLGGIHLAFQQLLLPVLESSALVVLHTS